MDYSKFRLRTFTKIQPFYSLLCGSHYELPLKYTSVYFSDVDALYYCYDICAIPWNRNPPKNTRCTILRIDSTETPSGYAKLKIHGDREKAAYYRRPTMLDTVEGGGPSIPKVTQSSSTIQEQCKKGCCKINIDNVFAVYCPYWPVEAEEWRVRKRYHGWPNEKLIARITRGGCHFVSKLRIWSSCDDTEWRFSFSKAELLLIHSWTPDQKRVYDVIRAVKRRISEYCGGDENKALQTYYFKTLMLWACEEFPPKFWREENVIACIVTLLIRFHRCLKEICCPSYFIPDCNIMSHVKEWKFHKEFQALLKFLVNIEAQVYDLPFATTSQFGVKGSFEQICLKLTQTAFPIIEHINGRFGEYLSDCEWFLPGMKYLHAAIEAQLRLMSIDNVASRKESKDYVQCLENFKCSLIKNEDLESLCYAHFDLSFYENINAILIRKKARNSIPVYHRRPKIAYGYDVFIQKFKESSPSPLFFVVLANLANFLFTAMQSYKESLTECKRGFDFLKKWKLEIANFDLIQDIHYIPFLICNSLSHLYDQHLQVILGFATLHRNIFSSESSNSSTCHETCLKLDPWEFLKYMCILCEQKLSSRPEKIQCFFPSETNCERPIMSQLVETDVYSAAILFAALRQSRIYTRPLNGGLIPRHYGHLPSISGTYIYYKNENKISVQRQQDL